MAHEWYGGLRIEVGRLEEALVERSLGEGADPSSDMAVSLAAELLIWLRRLDEALVKIEKLGRLDPDGSSYHSALAEYRLAQSDLEGSLEECRRTAESEDRPRWKRIDLAMIETLAGNVQQARRILREEETSPELPPTGCALAFAYAELHDLDGVFRWLNEAVDHHTIILKPFRADPRLEPVRKDPRFLLLLKRMNLA